GGDTLLTDPQILTADEVGSVFVDGNVASGYASFELDHKCNDFCQFFKLPTDYSNWAQQPFLAALALRSFIHRQELQSL
ncbi:hypothetical protein C8J57DRAFT_1069332, partial [Mycena rebaudengoi]